LSNKRKILIKDFDILDCGFDASDMDEQESSPGNTVINKDVEDTMKDHEENIKVEQTAFKTQENNDVYAVIEPDNNINIDSKELKGKQFHINEVDKFKDESGELITSEISDENSADEMDKQESSLGNKVTNKDIEDTVKNDQDQDEQTAVETQENAFDHSVIKPEENDKIDVKELKEEEIGINRVNTVADEHNELITFEISVEEQKKQASNVENQENELQENQYDTIKHEASEVVVSEITSTKKLDGIDKQDDQEQELEESNQQNEVMIKQDADETDFVSASKESTNNGENGEADAAKHEVNHCEVIDENEQKSNGMSADSDIYKEFAAQQRLIHFEGTHQVGKNREESKAQTEGPSKKISTNLSLNGYNIRFDMFGPNKQPSFTSASVVCERATTSVTII